MPDGAASIEDVLAGRARWALVEDDALDVLRGLPQRSVDCVCTDPPYGINTKSDGNGKLSPWADLCNAAFWYAAWINECRRVLKPTGCLWSCLNWRSLVTFQKAACDIRWPIESMMIWDKKWIGPSSPKGLRPSYEMVALWAKEDFAVANRGLPDVQPFPWSSHKPNGHPAEKPVELMTFCVEHGSPDNGVAFDPFAGSGTTIVAALKAGRRAIGAETDAEHAALARARLEKADTGGPLFAAPQADLFGGDKEAS